MPHPDAAPAPLDRRRIGLVVCGLLAGAAVVMTLAGGTGITSLGADYGWFVSLYGVVVYTGVGILVLWRRPGHGIGRLTLLIGLAFSVSVLLEAVFASLLPRGAVVAMTPGLLRVVLAAIDTLTMILTAISIFLGGTLLIAWFPDGHATGRPGRAVNGLVAGAAALALLLGLHDPVLAMLPWVEVLEAAFALASMAAIACLLLAFVIAAVDLVLRYRRADPVRQAQIRWVAAAAGFSGMMTALMVATTFVLDVEIPGLWDVWMLSLLLPVLAIGMAITRYHLYDIDRIVSRSISYILVSAVLFALFGALILVLQSLISGAVARPGEPIDPRIVAISTLVVAALFNPVRIRVQRAVDRRFHRARYDAERTVAGFSGHLRDQLDLPTLTFELRRATSAAVEPTASSVWLRPGSAAR